MGEGVSTNGLGFALVRRSDMSAHCIAYIHRALGFHESEKQFRGLRTVDPLSEDVWPWSFLAPVR